MGIRHGRGGLAPGFTIMAIAAAIGTVLGGCSASASREPQDVARAGTPSSGEIKPAGAAGALAPAVELNPTQLKTIKLGEVGLHTFTPQRVAVGSIDFNENLAVQIFPPYQGKIIEAYAQIGDAVAKGQPMYTIDSPDLIQAESTLIAAAGVYDLTTKVLTRARQLFETQGIAEKDMQQAVSDQQTAEGALKAARDGVRVFGKTDAEIDSIVDKRKIDPALVVRSPIGGRVTARFAQPGLLVQPGNAPAPYSVADISTMWMLANVAETDAPLFHLGQQVKVKMMAFTDRDFAGKISMLGATVDPGTHTMLVRSDVRDPKHELRPGMFATFVIDTGAPAAAIAVPGDSVVREGDGTMTVWVTTDQRHFTRRTVQLGILQDGFDQIVDGLQPGEQVVVEGAIFLSNMLNAGTQA
jgi:membrane fusion protein, heavy metal efflux system